MEHRFQLVFELKRFVFFDSCATSLSNIMQSAPKFAPCCVSCFNSTGSHIEKSLRINYFVVGRARFERATIALKVTYLQHKSLLINYLQNSPSSNLLRFYYTLRQHDYSVVTNLLHTLNLSSINKSD